MSDRLAESVDRLTDLMRRRLEFDQQSYQEHKDRQRESLERLSHLKDEMLKPQDKFAPVFQQEEYRKTLERLEEERLMQHQFQERLLSLLERQNALLERIANRFEQGPASVSVPPEGSASDRPLPESPA